MDSFSNRMEGFYQQYKGLYEQLCSEVESNPLYVFTLPYIVGILVLVLVFSLFSSSQPTWFEFLLFIGILSLFLSVIVCKHILYDD